MSAKSVTYLYLVTHAHTQIDAGVDATQWQLSPRGQEQAQRLAEQAFWASVDQLILSSEAKTKLTVEPLLQQRALPVIVDPQFDELYRPGWVEDYQARVAQAFAFPDQPAGEWETAAYAQQRMLNGIASLHQRFAGQTLALVGHGLTLSLYRAALLGQSRVNLAEWQRLSFAAVALVELESGQLLQDFRAVAGESPRGG
jgi:broad specificity phosphatase PhoE